MILAIRHGSAARMAAPVCTVASIAVSASWGMRPTLGLEHGKVSVTAFIGSVYSEKQNFSIKYSYLQNKCENYAMISVGCA
jgi:hypothetical protein